MSKEPSVIYSLTVKDPLEALEFYSSAFDAEELFRMPMPNGDIAHCEFTIKGSLFMMSGEAPDWKAYAMSDDQYASCLFGINVDDSHSAFQQAIDAGATPISEPEDQPWGWRTALIRDPFGYRWNLRQQIEELTNDEMVERMKQLMGG